nr:hypothetical protein [Bacillus canaveralius]
MRQTCQMAAGSRLADRIVNPARKRPPIAIPRHEINEKPYARWENPNAAPLKRTAHFSPTIAANLVNNTPRFYH